MLEERDDTARPIAQDEDVLQINLSRDEARAVAAGTTATTADEHCDNDDNKYADEEEEVNAGNQRDLDTEEKTEGATISSSADKITITQTSSIFLRPKVPICFLLLGVHSNPFVEHNGVDMDERREEELRQAGKYALSGLTIVCLDYANLDRVTYRGFCLRASSAALPLETRPMLVYRDRFCNTRNFDRIMQSVTTFHTYPRPIVTTTPNGPRAKKLDNRRRCPKWARCIESTYTYNCSLLDKYDTSCAVSECHGGFIVAKDANTSARYVEYYEKIAQFIGEQCDQRGYRLADTIIYHKLPVILSSWLIDDIVDHLTAYPPPNFQFLHKRARVPNVRISPHCVRRENHNSSVCEICLTDEIAPQLIDCLLEDEASATTTVTRTANFSRESHEQQLGQSWPQNQPGRSNRRFGRHVSTSREPQVTEYEQRAVHRRGRGRCGGTRSKRNIVDGAASTTNQRKTQWLPYVIPVYYNRDDNDGRRKRDHHRQQ